VQLGVWEFLLQKGGQVCGMQLTSLHSSSSSPTTTTAATITSSSSSSSRAGLIARLALLLLLLQLCLSCPQLCKF
jgi:hypothetical protein